MAITVRNIDNTYMLLQGVGEITVDNFIQANEYVYSHADKDTARFQLVDLTGITSDELSTENISRIAAQDKTADLGQMIIAVVASRGLDFGLSRMWEILVESEEIETHIFRETSPALKWLLSEKKPPDFSSFLRYINRE